MQLSLPASVRPLRPSEHQALLESLKEPEFSDGPLNHTELVMATAYWQLLAGNIIGDCTCEEECSNEMPNSGLLTNDPEQVHRSALAHIEIGLAAHCERCAYRHIAISEALSYHAELLRCAVAKDSIGALKASRRRDALLRIIRG